MPCCSKTYWFLGVACLGIISMAISGAFSGPAAAEGSNNQENTAAVTVQEETKSMATFGGGCFWCVEAVFQELDGVSDVTSGYMGGQVENPTYRDVCNGTTGHAEVCQITYDPEKVSYQKLLEVFFATHDPTTLNRQGADSGTQYRSVVFYHDDEQKQIAETIKKKLDEAGAYNNPVVTEITSASTYYLAEDYHQDYFSINPQQPYCSGVIAPKMAKFRKVFQNNLKSR